MTKKKKIGRPCTVCSKRNCAELERRWKATPGRLRAAFAAKYRLTKSAFENHFAARHAPPSQGDDAEIAELTWARPPLPPLARDATPVDRARNMAAWLWACALAMPIDAPPSEVARLGVQLTSATRLLARMTGAVEITPARIMSSAPWMALTGVIRKALAPHPEALRKIDAALAGLAAEG